MVSGWPEVELTLEGSCIWVSPVRGMMGENGAQGKLTPFLLLHAIILALEFTNTHILLGPPYADA